MLVLGKNCNASTFTHRCLNSFLGLYLSLWMHLKGILLESLEIFLQVELLETILDIILSRPPLLQHFQVFQCSVHDRGVILILSLAYLSTLFPISRYIVILFIIYLSYGFLGLSMEVETPKWGFDLGRLQITIPNIFLSCMCVGIFSRRGDWLAGDFIAWNFCLSIFFPFLLLFYLGYSVYCAY